MSVILQVSSVVSVHPKYVKKYAATTIFETAAAFF